MPWVVGLDEAGYGPNLGPLVQAAIVAKLPETDPAGWSTLASLVRQANDKALSPKRLLIDDSKRVHTGKHGLRQLEHGLAALLGPIQGTLGKWLSRHALPEVLNDLRGEAWFDPDQTLPLFPDGTSLARELETLGVQFRVLGVKLVPTPLFNQIIDGSNSKATVLTIGLTALLAQIPIQLRDSEAVLVYCDKQGGRSHYTAAVQAAFPDGWVVNEVETATESRYRVESLGRAVKLIFTPRAESGSISVALASMLAKYLREVCMIQFNAFWQKYVPKLQPTAGYPQDAKRFLTDITPAMEQLGLRHEQVWRSR